MNKEEIAKVTNWLCTAYNRTIGAELLDIMLADYRDMSYQQFMEAAQAHRKDVERGRFFPSLADIRYQIIGDRSQAKAQAGIDFDANPRIDGTSSFDENSENQFKRDARRRAWIERAAYHFEGQELGNQHAAIEQNVPRTGMKRMFSLGDK